MYTLDQIIHIINASAYKFDTSGVVGMLGGDNAVDALETIHLHVGRRWVAWYNYPGAITVAKRFGQMADSRLWDSLFPGPNLSPAATFQLDGESGPDYSGSYSGTKLTTKYLGHLTVDACNDLPDKVLSLIKKDGSEGRKTRSSAVTVISLPPKQHGRISRIETNASVAPSEPPENITIPPNALPPKQHGRISRIKTNASVPPGEPPGNISIPPNGDPSIALWAIVPSLVSMAASALCLLGHDPICASLIILGILCSGFSSIVLGGAKLRIRVPVPSVASPPGDGVMLPQDGSIIVLKGEEADVNIITKGEFELDYSSGILPHDKHHSIGVSSLLLMGQFLAQLLFIPRGTFFGQILYLVSFVASGGYHLFVASYERKKIHRDLLLRDLGVRMEKRTLGTRTQMAVFVCLLLGNSRPNPSTCKPDAVLSNIIPNDTPVWKYWRRKVSKELDHFWQCDSSSLYAPVIQAAPEDQADQPDQDEYLRFTEKELELLRDLIDDAWCVFNKYPKWRDDEAEVWKDGSEHIEEKSLLLSDCSSV